MHVTRSTRVLIADDHPYVLDGLVNLLKDKFDIVAAVTDGHLLVDAASRLRPEVIVTDVSMPGEHGPAMLRRMRRNGSTARFLVVTSDPTDGVLGGAGLDDLPAAEAEKAGDAASGVGLVVDDQGGQHVTYPVSADCAVQP